MADEIDESEIPGMSEKTMLMSILRMSIINTKDIQFIKENHSELAKIVEKNCVNIQRNTGDIDGIIQTLEERMTNDERQFAEDKQRITWAIAIIAISSSIVLSVVNLIL